MTLRRIYFQTTASTSIEIDVPDEMTDPQAILTFVEDQSIDFPTLCGHCEDKHLELDDNWSARAIDGELANTGWSQG